MPPGEHMEFAHGRFPLVPDERLGPGTITSRTPRPMAGHEHAQAAGPCLVQPTGRKICANAPGSLVVAGRSIRIGFTTHQRAQRDSNGPATRPAPAPALGSGRSVAGTG